ncbi:hypothetical protein GCM10009801_46920 [Streptomyces albiaxialis]|uniref:Uncharacterized protein n=1 Tax=Streptomyces albiaxialis TaxID=329523 RepID=A0ABN2W7T7_9ACTN
MRTPPWRLQARGGVHGWGRKGPSNKLRHPAGKFADSDGTYTLARAAARWSGSTALAGPQSGTESGSVRCRVRPRPGPESGPCPVPAASPARSRPATVPCASGHGTGNELDVSRASGKLGPVSGPLDHPVDSTESLNVSAPASKRTCAGGAAEGEAVR